MNSDMNFRAVRVVNLLCLLIACLPAGCGPRVYGVNQSLARETLVQVLDRWKAGATPESLQSGSPKIVVQDMDWMSGVKLADYEITGPEKVLESNLVVKVKLDLVDKSDQKVSKTVGYVVTTNPVLTVFRDMFN